MRTLIVRGPASAGFLFTVTSLISACSPQDDPIVRDGSGGNNSAGDNAIASGGSDTAAGGSIGSSGGNGGASGGTLGGGGTTSSTGGNGSGGEADGSGSVTGSGGTSGGLACPSDAYFCADFEGAGLPAGTNYHPAFQAEQWESFMSIQSTTVHRGAQALQVMGNDGYMWNILSAPVPSNAFWARFYLRSTVEIGQSDHNSYVAAMTGDGDPNAGDNTEISEQYCQMVLNLHDHVAVSIGGTERCETGVPPLSKDEWHCMEVYFDGAGGIVQVFADDAPVIDVSGWQNLDYKTFGFGYFGFHGPARTLWYDDVAVGPTRPGCL